MSQPTPPDWPPQQPQNPFGDRGSDPFAPGGAYSAGHRTPDIADDPAMRWILPLGQSVWSIISGYSGLLSLATCFLGPITVITGVIGIFELRRNPRLSGWGRAIIGITLGTLGSIGFVVMIIALVASGGR